MEWTQDKLWELRQQIMLNSLFIKDYANTFRVDPKVACDFFDGYMEYLEDEAGETGLDTNKIENIFAQDNSDNLWAWYNMIEGTPLPTIPKKFWITFEVNGGVEVEADDEDEARSKFVWPSGDAMLIAIDSNEPYITDIEEVEN